MDSNDHTPREPLSPKSKEVVVRQVRQLMSFWSITQEELERAWMQPYEPLRQPPSAAIKYRHPVTGETWDGAGEHPPWLRRALLQEGYTVAQMRPENQRDADVRSPRPVN